MFIASLGGLLAWLVWGIIALMVMDDASDRYPLGSGKPLLWALLVFLCPIMLLIYLLVRPRNRR